MYRDREMLGKLAWETYRMAIERMTDEREPPWEMLDHERQIAFRDAAESVLLQAELASIPPHVREDLIRQITTQSDTDD